MATSAKRKNVDVPPVDEIEGDFIKALSRLLAGKPKEKSLLARAKRGALRVTVTTVAKEAGHSRTLIGHNACKYPNVRDRIMALKLDPETPTRLQDVVTKQREAAAMVRRQLAQAHTHNATLVARIIALDLDVTRLTREVERLKARRPTATLVNLTRKE